MDKQGAQRHTHNSPPGKNQSACVTVASTMALSEPVVSMLGLKIEWKKIMKDFFYYYFFMKGKNLQNPFKCKLFKRIHLSWYSLNNPCWCLQKSFLVINVACRYIILCSYIYLSVLNKKSYFNLLLLSLTKLTVFQYSNCYSNCKKS